MEGSVHGRPGARPAREKIAERSEGVPLPTEDLGEERLDLSVDY
jgi:hypothetical protein